MSMFAPGFAPVLRRAVVAMTVAMVALPLTACSDEGKLVLHTSTGDYSFNVDVADTNESRQKGLMFVQDLADDAGMLFDFQQEREVSFWMRNTFIPLDMIFVGADGVIKTIHVNARPHDVTSIPSEVPVRFVLEIPGGRSVEIGLEPGDTMEHALVAKPAS
jgi:uncharacterized protein